MSGDPLFFGYGSLVNLATHDYADPHPARLAGWRRVWRHTKLRDAAFLSVERCEQTEISGIVARVPGADWAALDAREAAYARRDVTDTVRHQSQPGPVAVYEVEDIHLSDRNDHPILQSYLDVVVQGYLRVFGEAEAQAFFETTHGWDTPILDDRADPIYPRAQRLSPDETLFVDEALARFAGSGMISRARRA